MADWSQSLVDFTNDAAPVAQGIDGHTSRSAFTFGGGVVFYDMLAIDPACSLGTAPTEWTVQGAPDLTASQAPAFPCGAGPYDPIWIGRKY